MSGTKKILEIPKHLKGKDVICRKNGDCICPFYDDGDSGYGSHCNLIWDYHEFNIPEVTKILEKLAVIRKKPGYSYRERPNEVDELNDRLRYIRDNSHKFCPLSDAK